MISAESGEPSNDAASKCPRLQFGLLSLLRFQLLIVPALLSPVYHRIYDRNHPYVVLLAFLVAPICYISVFSSIRAMRIRKQRFDIKRSVVFAAIRCGACFGALFSVMAIGPLVVLTFVDIFGSMSGLTQMEILLGFAVMFLVAVEAVFIYAILGAATGGAIGLFVDARRNQTPQNATKPTG